MTEETLALILLPLGAAFFAGIIFFSSRYSGWHTLATRYPLRTAFPAPKDRYGYAVFRGWVGYNGGIIVACDARGLYLRAMPVILSFCHAPIHIPWTEIRSIESRSGFWSGGYRLHILRATEIEFALRFLTFAAIRDDAKRAGVAGNY